MADSSEEEERAKAEAAAEVVKLAAADRVLGAIQDLESAALVSTSDKPSREIRDAVSDIAGALKGVFDTAREGAKPSNPKFDGGTLKKLARGEIETDAAKGAERPLVLEGKSLGEAARIRREQEEKNKVAHMHAEREGAARLEAETRAKEDGKGGEAALTSVASIAAGFDKAHIITDEERLHIKAENEAKALERQRLAEAARREREARAAE